MSSKKLNPFKDFQSDQIQRSSRKIFNAHYACRNAALNLTPVTGTANGFIFQIINSLIESWGVRLTWFDCNRARFFLPKPCLKTLYYCLVYPYLHYCIVVWGSTYKTNLRRLVSLQKRVIRIISKSTFDSHSDPIFKELELLKLSDIRQLELGKFMFSLNHSLFPFKVQQLFFFKQTSP